MSGFVLGVGRAPGHGLTSGFEDGIECSASPMAEVGVNGNVVVVVAVARRSFVLVAVSVETAAGRRWGSRGERDLCDFTSRSCAATALASSASTSASLQAS